MKNDRLRKPGVHQLHYPCPRHTILLTATPQRAPPEIGDVMPEHLECPTIGGHCVVVEVAADNPLQPSPLRGDWLGHTPSHRLLDLPQLCPHAVRSGFPFDLESSRVGFSADEGEAQEVEGLRLAEPA